MELHEQLHDLGQHLGRTVFGNPDDFRAALDDYLDEGAASADDIALLVDAVRAGSLSSLTTTLAGGADPAWAIDRVGDDLARERGDDEPVRSRWAVAALGYATGSVPHELPARLWRESQGSDPQSSDPGGGAGSGADRTQLSQSRAPWPTAGPPPSGGPGPSSGSSSGPGSGASPWPQANPAAPGPAAPQPTPAAAPRQPLPQQPAAQSPSPPQPSPPPSGGGVDFEAATRVGAPPAGSGSGSGPVAGPGGPPAGGWQGPPPAYPATGGPQPGSFGGPPPSPAKKSKLPVIIAAVLAVVLIVAGGVYVAIAKPFGGDDKNDAKKDETSESSSGGSGSASADVAVDNASLNERYSALGSDVTKGASDCKAGQPATGQTEVVSCKIGTDITLTLATYQDINAFEAGREKVTTFAYGNLYSEQPGGVFYSEARETGNTVVYWDANSGFRSAELVSASSDLVTVTDQFTSTSPTVDVPTEIESERLRTLVADWIPNVDDNCYRAPTNENDMRELAICSLDKVGSFYVGEMVNRAKMRQLRNRYQGFAKQFDGRVGPWNFKGGSAKGTLIEYVDPWEQGDPEPKQDRAFLMWDNEFHKVFIQGWAFDADEAKFKKWWETA